MNRAIALFGLAALFAVPANAATVTVAISGQVIFNAIAPSPLGDVNSGDNVVMSFTVDSNDFVDGVPGDTRGYVIDQSSFSMTFDTPVSVGLANPFPAGQTPYFTLVDGFPVSDGFFVSTSSVSPGGVPLAQAPYEANLDLGYEGSTLSSLDILDAVGEYDFAGLTRFGFTVWSISPDNVAMEIDFQRMSIEAVPVPAAVWLFAPALLGLLRFRRRR